LVISYPGYLQVFANIQNNYLTITKQMNGLHPIYQEGQLWLTLAALGIGLSLGIVAFFANRRLIPDKLEIEKPIRLDG